MVVFIDESYSNDANGIWHYALGGFGVDEFRYRALQAAVYQLVRSYFDAKANYAGDSWRAALRDKIITSSAPHEIELKARFLLSSGALRRFGGERSPHYRLASDLLARLADCRCTSVGVCVRPTSPTDVKDCTYGCPIAFTKLIQTVGEWMVRDHPGEPVTLVLDTEHSGVNLPLTRSIADYLYRSDIGKKMKHIFPAPFWIDSRSMAGSQIADLVAHIIMNSMLPEAEMKPVKGLWSRVWDLRARGAEADDGTIIRIP